jgi:tetratricopeptide (TPR) repeat protein
MNETNLISGFLAKALLHCKAPAAILLAGSALYGQTQLWRSDPNTVTVQELWHNVPAAAQREMRQAEKALARGNVLGIDPDRISQVPDRILLTAARNNLAFHLIPTEPESAIRHFEEAARINPHHPLLFANLAVAYCLIQKFDAAELAARRS